MYEHGSNDIDSGCQVSTPNPNNAQSHKCWKRNPHPQSIITQEHFTVDPICVCFQRKNFYCKKNFFKGNTSTREM